MVPGALPLPKGNPAAASRPGAGRGGAFGSGVAAAAGAAAPGSVPTTALAKCSACGRAPMEAPHVSVCGHAACYPCWLKAIALMQCPGCKKHVRKSQLTKMYFR